MTEILPTQLSPTIGLHVKNVDRKLLADLHYMAKMQGTDRSDLIRRILADYRNNHLNQHTYELQTDQTTGQQTARPPSREAEDHEHLPPATTRQRRQSAAVKSEKEKA